MYFNLIPEYKIEKKDFLNKEILFKKIKEINDICLEQTYQERKIAYYYENSVNGDIFSYNKDICFYAASTIKILPALILFERASQNRLDLTNKIMVTMDELKQGSGIIKEQLEDTEYSLLELIKLSLIVSDNTAYLKLVEYIGKDNIKEYGLSIGATHTMESLPTDSFGIVNCNDMIIYLKKIVEYINGNNTYSDLFKEYLLNSQTKLIKDESIDNQNFLRKYGFFDIAYHEVGYVEGEEPYYLIILTQLNKFDYKEDLINDLAKRILEIHNITKVIPREDGKVKTLEQKKS